MMARIMAIDDDVEIRTLLRLFLEEAGHECIIVNGAERALEVLRYETPDLIVTDIMMPGLSGGEIYDVIRRECGPTLPVIISTGKNLKFRDQGDPLLGIFPKQNDYSGMMDMIERLLGDAQKLREQR